MGFYSKASDLITLVNNFKGTREEHTTLVKEVCDLFDLSVYEKNFSDVTIALLYFFSNLIGVPQYFDLFCKLNNIDHFDSFSNMLILGSLIKESSLMIDKDTKVHIFQKEVIDRFDKNTCNRFIISAPTSFGKTFIIYHLIEKMNYENIVLIFPTISLLSENLKRIIDLKQNGYLKDYNVLTLSEEKLAEKKNILIFTPERFMTFLDKNPQSKFDFLFFDEIYKIDNDFIVETNEEVEQIESSRDVTFRISLEFGLTKTKDALLAGPFLQYENSQTMSNFIKDNDFISLDYNDVELVSKKKVSYNDLKSSNFDGLDFSKIQSKNNTDKIFEILKRVKKDETIIYCSRRNLAEDYALKISEKESLYIVEPNDRFNKLIAHLESKYTKNWCLIKTLKKGIGIHHGTIPKYIQREIISLFNLGVIKCIFSTTTITEGVNTTAKNMIIISHKKGIKDLKRFDILNIMGRAGRFSKHYSGRVFILDNKLNLILDSDAEVITHKNYGIETTKTDVDLEFTRDEYLSDSDAEKKIDIAKLYDKNEIPDNIRNSFLTVSPTQKVKLFKLISYAVERVPEYVSDIIKSINSRGIKLDQIQLLITIIEKVIDDKDRLYSYLHKGNNEYSVITYMINSYLIGGFDNMLIYELERNSKIDTAIRKVSNLVYNIFRYELVKYISVIDLIYRTIISKKENKSFDETTGFGGLLSYLEYGAYTDKGRKASDLGLPSNVIKHIDGGRKNFDAYEQLVYDEMKILLE